MNRTYILFICLLAFASATSQNRVDIRFAPSLLSEDKSCFDLELKAIQSGEIMLAGQNYRIFYNPNKLKFLPEELTTYGSREVYSHARVLRHHHSDEISTAMFNLGIDTKELNKSKTIKVNQAEWIKTSNVCFAHQSNSNYQLTWAREERTADLATAFISMSEWISEKRQKKVLVNEYFDYNSKNSRGQFELTQIKIYPNPVVRELQLKLGQRDLIENGTAFIIDGAGRQIQKKKISTTSSNYTFDLSGIPSGNYFVELKDAAGTTIYQSSFIKSTL